MMGFFKLVFFAALAVTSALPTESLQERGTGQCTSSDFVTPVVKGGTGTTSFCESNWGSTYLPIVALKVWGGENFVTGIQATYSDGTSSQIYGFQATYKVQSITIDYSKGDSISQLILYTYANAKYVRHIRIRTSKGAGLDVGEPVSDGYLDANPQLVGTGVLFGFQGSTDGTRVQSLGFLLLDSAISEIVVSNLTFPNGPQGTDGIAPTTLDRGHFFNDQTNGADVTWQFNNQISRQVAYAFSQTTTDTFAFMMGVELSASFKGTAPGVETTLGGKTTSSFTWTNSYMEQRTRTVTTAHQVQWNAQGTLHPGQGVDCTAIAGVGSGTFQYTSRVTITLKNGHQYSWPESGKLTMNDVSSAIVDVVSANHR